MSDGFIKVKDHSDLSYKAIADYAYDWETWEDEDGLVKYVSPSCERISGYSADEFTANHMLLDSIILDEDREEWDNHRRHIHLYTRPHTAYFRIRNKNGRVVWIEQIGSMSLVIAVKTWGFRPTIEMYRIVKQQRKHSKGAKINIDSFLKMPWKQS